MSPSSTYDCGLFEGFKSSEGDFYLLSYGDFYLFSFGLSRNRLFQRSSKMCVSNRALDGLTPNVLVKDMCSGLLKVK